MKVKLVKLKFRELEKVKIFLDSEPLPINSVICPSNLHPRCHGAYVPSHEQQQECLLCEIFKRTSPPTVPPKAF